MTKTKTITVKGNEIAIIQKGKDDFISLTDMAKGFEDSPALIEKWLRNKILLNSLAFGSN